MTGAPVTGGPPLWLPRAWRVRAVLLTLALGLLALALYARWSGMAHPAAPLVLPGAAAVIVAALWLDWRWLLRNHHRVNEWGLSRGKDARKKPK